MSCGRRHLKGVDGPAMLTDFTVETHFHGSYKLCFDPEKKRVKITWLDSNLEECRLTLLNISEDIFVPLAYGYLAQLKEELPDG